MTQRAKAVYACPRNVRAAEREPRVAEALTDKWRRACVIAKAMGDDEESVRYALVKLHAKGQAERYRKPGTGRIVYFYRRPR